jgi:hypothetical protein
VRKSASQAGFSPTHTDIKTGIDPARLRRWTNAAWDWPTGRFIPPAIRDVRFGGHGSPATLGLFGRGLFYRPVHWRDPDPGGVQRWPGGGSEKAPQRELAPCASRNRAGAFSRELETISVRYISTTALKQPTNALPCYPGVTRSDTYA